MNTKLFTVAVLLLLACPLATSLGQSESNRSGLSFGARAGYGINPDQFVIGVQGVSRPMSYGVTLAPSIDLGFGDNVTTYLFNLDVRFLSPRLPGSTTSIYVGAGPAISIYSAEGLNSDTEIGVNIVGGLKLPMGSSNAYSLEGRIGIGDVPDFRILFGVMLGGGK